jgi:hypothetical protein
VSQKNKMISQPAASADAHGDDHEAALQQQVAQLSEAHQALIAQFWFHVR